MCFRCPWEWKCVSLDFILLVRKPKWSYCPLIPAVPYDIANIFIRPIAGVIGVSISVALLLILFFGVITSPFGYFFGVPSRKYVMGGVGAIEAKASPRLFPSEGILNTIQEMDLFPPPSSKAFFFWMDGEDLDGDCQLLALCHAHAAIQFLPLPILRIYGIVR